MPVSFPQIASPITMGFQAGNFSSTAVTSTFETMDIADMLNISGRGLIAGGAVSAGIRKVFIKSAEQAILKEGSAAMMRGAAHQAENAALSLGTGVQTAAKGMVARNVVTTTQQVAAHGMKATSLRTAANEIEGSITAPKAGGLFKGSLGNTIKRSALVGGLISVGVNFYHAVTGKITATQAGGNVVADTVGSVVGGVAAAGAAALVGSLIAAPGILMTAATFLAGTVAFVGVDALMRVSGAHKGIAEASTGLIESIVDYFKTKIGPGGV
ncbi:MAG: hypothetical protein H7338_11020 [Candidatus Sericytochromatia bacterium]|nr:hypothetical protein [Candidatus Sericytochromatia bacterium]